MKGGEREVDGLVSELLKMKVEERDRWVGIQTDLKRIKKKLRANYIVRKRRGISHMIFLTLLACHGSIGTQTSRNPSKLGFFPNYRKV